MVNRGNLRRMPHPTAGQIRTALPRARLVAPGFRGLPAYPRAWPRSPVLAPRRRSRLPGGPESRRRPLPRSPLSPSPAAARRPRSMGCRGRQAPFSSPGCRRAAARLSSLSTSTPAPDIRQLPPCAKKSRGGRVTRYCPHGLGVL